MSLTYYDSIEARQRLKRRYKWAILAYLVGFATAALIFNIR